MGHHVYILPSIIGWDVRPRLRGVHTPSNGGWEYIGMISHKYYIQITLLRKLREMNSWKVT